MSLPSRKQQIQAMADMLDSEKWDDLSLTELATKVVDEFHDFLTSGIKEASPPLHVGMAFKCPFTTKVHHVAWMDDTRVWIVSADSHFGWFGCIDDPYWEYIEESKAKTGAPGNNKEWPVGDKVSLSQRKMSFEVIATGDKCVLLRDATGWVQADSNENMAKYYRRELL